MMEARHPGAVPASPQMTSRPLAESDAPRAAELLQAEGWGFTTHEILRLITLGGGHVLEASGVVQGLLTHTRFAGLDGGATLAWIGNVVLDPSLRGQGAGERLVADAVRSLDEDGVDSIRLYSVLPAVTLYRRLGFTDDYTVTSWTGSAPGTRALIPRDARLATRDDLDAIAAFDRTRFGADRRHVLAALMAEDPDAAFVVTGPGGIRAYAIAKRAQNGGEIGPVMAVPGDTQAAEAALDAALGSMDPGPVEVAFPDSNGTARTLLEARGFRPAFRTLTMTRGAPIRDTPASVIAVAGLEKG